MSRTKEVYRSHPIYCQWQCLHCGAANDEFSSIDAKKTIRVTNKTAYSDALQIAERDAVRELHTTSKILLERVNAKRKYAYTGNLFDILSAYSGFLPLSGMCKACGAKQPWIPPKPLRFLDKVLQALCVIGLAGSITASAGILISAPLKSLIAIPLIFIIAAAPFYLFRMLFHFIWQAYVNKHMRKASDPQCYPKITIDDLPDISQIPDPRITDAKISRHRKAIVHDSATWKCAACSAENPNSRGSCAKCGKYK